MTAVGLHQRILTAAIDSNGDERGRPVSIEIEGVRIHFVHERSSTGRGVPLVLTNGWPNCSARISIWRRTRAGVAAAVRGRTRLPRPVPPLAHEDRGYGAIQPTRAQTVGYGLNDSPAGLARGFGEVELGLADVSDS